MTMTRREWKGQPSLRNICGEPYKVGLQMHPDMLCKEAPGHAGKHKIGFLSWQTQMPQEAEELDEHLRGQRT